MSENDVDRTVTLPQPCNICWCAPCRCVAPEQKRFEQEQKHLEQLTRIANALERIADHMEGVDRGA
jgi:hypothetical protein